MDGNKWQELNSSGRRIGQSSAVEPVVADAPLADATSTRDDDVDRDGGGLPVAAKAALACAGIAMLAIGGFVFATSGGSETTDAGAEDERVGLASDDDVLAEAVAIADDDPAADDDNPDSVDGTLDDGVAGDERVPDSLPSTDDAGDTDSGDPDSDGDDADDQSVPDDASAESPIGADSPPSPPGAPPTHSILANGKIYLRGTVPSELIEGFIVAAVAEVLGEGNVISEYAIDPSVPFDPDRGAPVYIADTVLFAPGSSTIAPDFYPLLGLGVSLVDIQPTVTIEIVGHTDAQGSDADNLALSQARVDAVRDWMVSQGGDPERLTATGKGESEPRADNGTAEGRQFNRRVEFLISGFEFG